MIKRASAVFAAAMLALSGCSGEDGDPGAAGQDGTDGTSCTVASNGDGTSTITCEDGTVATISDGSDGTNGQSCLLTANPDGTRTLTCPGGSVIVLPAPAITGKVAVSDQVATTDGADVVITFKVKLNGVASSAFTNKVAGSSSAYRHTYNATTGEGTRTGIADTLYTVTADATGSYTARFPGMATTIGTTPTTFLMKLNTGVTQPQATVVAHSPAGAPKSTVSDQACMNCHANNVFAKDGEHHGVNPQGVSACVVCHVTSSNSRGQNGDRLKSYVHGIHNSHAMPARDITQATIDPDGNNGPLAPVDGPFTVTKPAGVYARNNTLNFVAGSYPDAPVAQISSPFSIGFPSYMNNCSTCHNTDENLAYVLDRPVTYSTCMSCHDGWAGFGVANTGTAESPKYVFGTTSTVDHAGFGPLNDPVVANRTNCASCHNGSFAPAKVGDFHNGLTTERGGLLWAGKDQSIEEAKKVKTEIVGVSDATFPPTTVTVQWVAYDPTQTGNPRYDPCNADANPSAGKPKFFGELQIRRAYAQGNDWVNVGVGTSPGQPGTTTAVNGTTTTCDATTNVATTTITYTDAEKAALKADTKAVASLNGRPRVWYTPANPAGAARSIQVRTPTPLREFVVGTGAEPSAANKRREIVSTEKCASCHFGSMYQHGGERIDNPNMCAMCHNPAANEKNVRVNMGVDASEAHDGKPGQTYDLRYMIHAIHSAGETNAPLIYYRTNGVYVFGSQAAIDALPNWPGAGCFDVYGSTESATSGANSTGSQCGTPAPAAGPGIPAKKNHNEIVVHYPQPLTNCGACHVNGSESKLPSTTSAVAVTVYDAGASPWDVQTDDVLMGPAAASCMSCHQSGDPAIQGALRAHSAQNGWAPTTFTTGRQYVLEGGVAESCAVCHGAGKTYDYAAKHGN